MMQEKPRIIILDGDVIAFQAAAAVQHTYVDQANQIHPFAHVGEGKVVVDNTISWLKTNLEADHVKVYLSDPSSNYRKRIDPTYKSNRSASVRPLLLATLRTYLVDTYGAEITEDIEADDILSMWGYQDGREYDVVIVGRDKDYNTIPGKYHRLGDRTAEGKPHIKVTTLQEANLFHLAQALAGDRVDGYFGCPTIGMTRALALLNDPQELYPTEGVITRGPKKGGKVIKWCSRPTKDLWRVVVTNYEKQGLTEADALRNARLAYLLRTDADLENRETAWVPEMMELTDVPKE